MTALRDRLLEFQEHYQVIAQPFQWKFTRHKLHRLLNKLDAPEQTLRRAA